MPEKALSIESAETFNPEQQDYIDFFRLEEEPIDNISINSFLQQCKTAKTQYFQDQENTFSTLAVQPVSIDDMVSKEFESKSIIPDAGLQNPKTKLDHLPQNIQDRMKQIFKEYDSLFSKSKHHLGTFLGFEAEALIDTSSNINCKQAPRNRVLPPSCKQDLLKYKTAGLFAESTIVVISPLYFKIR